MNRREFVKYGLCTAAIASTPELFARLTEAEVLAMDECKLLADVIALYESMNPIDPKTGKRKFISFGALSDLHACKRTPGDDAAINPVKDYWYYRGAVLTDSSPSIHLLGSIAVKVGLDAILHAGDFSTANTLKPFAPGDYRNVIRRVKAEVEAAAPGVPFFTVDGNHDREYGTTAAGNRMDNAEWAEVLKEVNSDVTENPNVTLTRHHDPKNPILNSYTLDFHRLVKSGGANVRIVAVSQYDRGEGTEIISRAEEGLRFANADSGIVPANTVVGFISHDMMKSLAPTVRTYLDKNSGARVWGAIAGHMHYAYMIPFGSKDFPLASKIHGITNCFCPYGTSSREAFRFSLLIVDTEAGKLREIRLAGGDKPNPKHPERELRPNHPVVSVSDIDSSQV